MTRADALNPADPLPAETPADSLPAETGADPRPPAAEPAPAPQAADGPRLKQLALRGAAWTVGGYGVSQVLRLGSNLILTRLLFPEAFGLMALVSVAVQGLQMFSDVGIGPSLIRSARNDERFVNTAWSIQVGRGIILAMLCLALASPLARAYAEPELAPLLATAAAIALLQGFRSTVWHTLNRELELGKIATREIVAQVCGIATMIVWAVLAPSVWALLAGNIVSAAMITLLSHRLTPQRARLAWDPAAAREILSFGAFIFIATAATFVGRGGERLVLGSFVPMAVLGQFSIALMLSQAPQLLAKRLTDRVLFPAFAALRRDSEGRALRLHRRARLGFMVLSLGLMGVWVLCGPMVIELLYDPRYHAAGWMLQFLGVRAMCETVRYPQQKALAAAGKPVYNAIGAVLLAITVFGGLLLALSAGQMRIGFGVLALSPIPGLLVMTWGMLRHFPQVRKGEVTDAVAATLVASATVGILLRVGT